MCNTGPFAFYLFNIIASDVVVFEVEILLLQKVKGRNREKEEGFSEESVIILEFYMKSVLYILMKNSKEKLGVSGEKTFLKNSKVLSFNWSNYSLFYSANT